MSSISTPRASGLELVKASGAELLHIHGGKVTKLVWYWDRDRPRRPRLEG